MKLGISWNGTDRALVKELQRYLKLSRKDRQTGLRQQAGKLAWDLYFAYRKFKAKVREIKRALKQGRIKPPPGSNPQREAARRIRAIGFGATGWLPALKKFAKVKSVVGPAVKRLLGRVLDGSRRVRASITFHNDTQHAKEEDEEHGIMNLALRKRTEDIRKYNQRKLRQRSREFNRR